MENRARNVTASVPTTISEGQLALIKAAQEGIQKLANDLTTISATTQVDVGRMVASLDKLREAYQCVEQAVILAPPPK